MSRLHLEVAFLLGPALICPTFALGAAPRGSCATQLVRRPFAPLRSSRAPRDRSRFIPRVETLESRLVPTPTLVNEYTITEPGTYNPVAFSLQVVDAATGAPVPGAQVQIFDGDHGNQPMATAGTGLDGFANGAFQNPNNVTFVTNDTYYDSDTNTTTTSSTSRDQSTLDYNINVTAPNYAGAGQSFTVNPGDPAILVGAIAVPPILIPPPAPEPTPPGTTTTTVSSAAPPAPPPYLTGLTNAYAVTMTSVDGTLTRTPEVAVRDGIHLARVAWVLGNIFPGFTGTVTAALGDVNHDGTLDLVVAAQAGGGPQVNIYNGADGSLMGAFFAFSPRFTGGVSLAVADVNGDGYADIIVGAGPGGGPQVAVFSGRDLSPLMSFYAFPAGFRGGVSVAAGDVTGDGKADIIVGAGAGGGPQVSVFDGATGLPLASYYALPPSFQGGINVGTTTPGPDGKVQVLVGAGAGALPQVSVFDGLTGRALSSFFAFPASVGGGVTVAGTDFNGQRAIVAGTGPGPLPSVSLFDLNGNVLDAFYAESLFGVPAGFYGGTGVGGGALRRMP